ncbi:T9SS type A sorting domain-containing protein [Flavobacterium wongokense]|uniref:T9SS type A sorting domain-containing protein n=1 Tax=Flavobacterium wongokense TaxID=2910674 RepID=UPI001F2C6AF8|nr:T9SS type A sorting domain-containing protein [Flavobacterium sp. WG47]MCF6133303.1 T9SS type A sorting domain-containing protein [Flavobacterium sp. WG47]
MEKNYPINPKFLLVLLVLLTFNFTAFAQSRNTGRNSQQNPFTQKTSVQKTVLNRPVAPTTQATTTVIACDSYTWPVNGQTYNLTGIYTSGGGITQAFNDRTAWDNSAAANGATVAFNDMAGIPAATTINISIGTTNLSLSAPGGMYTNGTFIGTNNSSESITITFNPPIYGLAGNFFVTNISDNVVSGNVTTTYSDGAVDSRTVNSDTETFGYFSTTPLTSLVLSTSTANRFISLNNISIATNPAADDTLDLTVFPRTVPTFTPVNPICVGDALSPLPTTSNNGIPGSWSPALDNTNTTTYTFTPDSGQCATTKTLTINVNPIVSNTTTLSACNSYTWPITGVTYTSSGQYVTTIPITDTTEIDDFNTWVQHAFSFNSTVHLADVSSIPATNPTIFTMGTTTINASAPGGMYSGPDFLGTTNPNNPITITFTPPVYGVSAKYFTTDINDNVISGNVTVTYSNGHVQSRTVTTNSDTFGYFDNNFISSIVLSSSTTVPNHYVGLKDLAIAANPTSCSTETLDLTINTTPPPGDTFATAIDVNTPNYNTSGNNLSTNCFTDEIGETTPDVWYRINLDACAQSMSLNTCTGSNFDTILTVYAQDGTTILGYSDDDCGVTRQSSITDLDISGEDVVYVMVEGYPGLGEEEGTYGLEITQTLLPQVPPTFQPVAGICNGDPLAALPTTSDNGITGSWSPALDNTVTTTYTFTPDPGICASQATLTINVTQPTIPTFTAVADICSGGSLSPLPTTSNNGYTGSWSPALNNTLTTIYTFTPDAGQCAATTTLTINVNQPVTPTFTPVADICNGDALSPLPTISNNGYTGTWSPALNNALTTTYTFTPTAGQCATTASLTITVNQPITPTFNTIAPICNGDSITLQTTSNNGYVGTWSPAINNTATTTYTFTPTPGQCATTATLTVVVNQPITPTFAAVAPICNGDSLSALPTTSINGYTGSWSPALNNTITTTYTFTPTAGQCANTASLTITVNQPVTPTFSAIAPICNGDSLSALPTTSINGYTGTWSPSLDNTSTTTYIFTPNAGQCANTASLTITVNQPVTPTFNAIAPICNGDSLSALPTTSINGYTGTWSPALNNTLTTTYTFTPTAGQCATTASLTITVNQPITPTFSAVAPICNGDSLSALPTTSINGYTGSWSPALNNTLTTTYTFTPTAGQCATTASLTITVNQPITPTFSAVTPICNGDSLSALPTTSINGYTGSWSPSLDNTITTAYTFTPDAGQCAAVTTLTITVNQPVTPTFTAVAPICNGDSLSALPTTSINGYTGSWSPALDNTSTTTYTFTPDAGQCAGTASLTITVNQPVTPTFNAIAPICNGDSLTLPTTSVNGFVGTWSPAFDNTATGTYTFTPNAGQCATTATLTITVNQPVTPTFNAIAPICNGDSLTLPTTSVNGFVGTWSPAFDNTATGTYTFTPNSGQCATTASLTITVNQPITPTFSAVAPICNGDSLSALPTTSINGYTGSWSPALNNTLTTTYTFTPTAGQCATTASLTITVNQPITPTFAAVAPICNGDSLLALPTTSINGYTGSWSPVLDNTITTVYTFTPDAGQCAAVTTLTITVNQPVTPTFNAVAPICNGGSLSALPTTSNNGYTGSWSPALDNTLTTIYTFTPDANQCAAVTTLTITVNQPTTIPTFTAIAPICNGDSLVLPTISNNAITGTWSPAIDNTATTTYTFTPDPGQCGVVTTLTVTVNQPVTPTFSAIAPICNGDSLVLPATSNNGISGTWSPVIDNTATTTYTFTPNVGECAITTSLTVTVNQPVTPTFNTIAPICNGDSLALPTTSNNGYTGTWSPAINNAATTTYTFTPTAGQCATTALLTVTVNQPIAPVFSAVAPICNGDSLSALPTTSNNGYTGSWSPALDNTITTTYTFTPDAGQCASTATLTITVNQPVTPTFNAVTPICNGGSLSALPITSNNGYTGSWSPGLDNTATTTYTFTPDAGQCAAVTTLTITVNQPTTVPTFTAIAPICNGDSLVLPTTSNNAITGTWSPAVDNTATTTYTFTPNPGQCGVVTTLTVTVNQPVTPTFNPLGPVCNGDSTFNLPTTSTNGISGTWSPLANNAATTTYTFTPNSGECAITTSLTVVVIDPTTPSFDAVAPICNGETLLALPTISNNGYSGTWSPALDNTATTTYTFTPTAGQCATTATLTISVNQQVAPTFTAVAPICNGDSLSALPTTSNNGFNGTWSPALNNTATTTYTFTPTAGQCATSASLTITVNQPVTPTFTPVGNICNGDPLLALPTTSINGITGTWSPALDNTTTTTYTFTPDSGQCAGTATMTITVHTTATPTGNAFQTFDVADLNDATVADLVVSPASVNWYGSLADALSLTNPLSLTTVLTNGATYYAVAFSATCPSVPFGVTVTVNLGNSGFDNLHFVFYPNPTSSVVNISYSENITQLTLMNMLGQIITVQNTNSTQVQMDLSRLAEATYFIKVQAGDKEKTIKIIKQR